MTTLSPVSKRLAEVGEEWNDAVANVPVNTDWKDDSSAGGNVRNMTPSAFDPAYASDKPLLDRFSGRTIEEGRR